MKERGFVHHSQWQGQVRVSFWRPGPVLLPRARLGGEAPWTHPRCLPPTLPHAFLLLSVWDADVFGKEAVKSQQ